MNPDGFPKVDVKYRANPEQLYSWESNQQKVDNRNVEYFMMLQRERRGFRIPNWVVALAALALIAALVWIFRQVIL